MGDRTGLKKLDRTNGYEDGRNYMKVKQAKLAQQNDQIRDAIRQRSSTAKSDLFKGISISVNGRTQPTADELKRLILLNGGDYHPYYRYQTTKFMIATNLSIARMKQLRPDDRIVRPEWITDSIQVNCLLPYEDYQLFVEESRGKNGSVLPIDLYDNGTSHSTSSAKDQQELGSVVDSYSRSYRDSRQRANQQKAEVTKCRDIREMFSRSVRSISNGPEVKQGTSGEVISITDSSLEDSSRGSKMNVDAEPSDNQVENPFDEYSNSPNQDTDDPAFDPFRELLATLTKPIRLWDPSIMSLRADLNAIVQQMSERFVDEDQPYYVLLHGKPGAGLTTIAANVASESEFPFIRIYQALATADKSESAKVQYMKKLFNDAAKRDLSCIVIDDLEDILSYSHIGPSFSITCRTLFKTFKDLTLPKNHRMLVICTCHSNQFLQDLLLTDIFNDIVEIPPVTLPNQVGNVLSELEETGESTFTPNQICELLATLDTIKFQMGIKKLERLIKNASRDKPEDRVRLFLERMKALKLTLL